MTQYKRIGVDTSKAVFTLHGIDLTDRPLLRINLRRPQFLSFVTTQVGGLGSGDLECRDQTLGPTGQCL